MPGVGEGVAEGVDGALWIGPDAVGGHEDDAGGAEGKEGVHLI